MQEGGLTGHFCQFYPLSSLIAFCLLRRIQLLAWRWNSLMPWNLVTVPSYLPVLFQFRNCGLERQWFVTEAAQLFVLCACLCCLPVEQVMIRAGFGDFAIFSGGEHWESHNFLHLQMNLHSNWTLPCVFMPNFVLVLILNSSSACSTLPIWLLWLILCCDNERCSEWILVRNTVEWVYLDQN